MQIGVIGLNHKQSPLSIREALAKACTLFFQREGLSEPFIPLMTCNRTEIYFSSLDLAETHSHLLGILKKGLFEEIGQELYSFFGVDCFYHLAKVTTGFDSATLAETEIQGQVKQAYQQAHQRIKLPFELHYLFQKALKVGKEIRTHLYLPTMAIDIEHAIEEFGKELFSPSILCIGASRTNFKIASHLQKRGHRNITFTNRNQNNLKKICEEGDFHLLPWERKGLWTNFDWVIVATKAQDFLLVTDDVKAPLATKLLVDLSVPRNIDPKLETLAPLINIDKINQLLTSYSSLLHKKQQEIDEKLEESALKYTSLFHEKSERLYAFG